MTKTAVAGDSTVRDLIKKINADVWCLPSHNINRMHQLLLHAPLEKYDLLVLMVGTCDIASNLTHKELLENYQLLINMLNTRFPALVIGVCGILPRTLDHTFHGWKVIAFNKGLQATAVDQDLIYFLYTAPSKVQTCSLRGDFLETIYIQTIKVLIS